MRTTIIRKIAVAALTALLAFPVMAQEDALKDYPGYVDFGELGLLVEDHVAGQERVFTLDRLRSWRVANLRELPERQRETLHLVCEEGLTVEEAAELGVHRHDLAVVAVHPALHRESLAAAAIAGRSWSSTSLSNGSKGPVAAISAAATAACSTRTG